MKVTYILIYIFILHLSNVKITVFVNVNVRKRLEKKKNTYKKMVLLGIEPWSLACQASTLRTTLLL